ncbi:hypothetical protein QYF36_005572 [Acer negundo]|nr:hypothetical protein QYF36_005572 [Acer negundo]
MKKYDKITLRSESTCYMNMVDNSYIGSSDELTKLMERVEVAFIKHFSNSNRRKGVSILRPKTKKAAHMVSFFTGTELGYMDVLLVSFGVAVLALTSVLMNLDMEMDPKTNDYKALTELLPLGLVLLVIVVVICPLNILYRRSRFLVLSCLFHCICAPLYMVAFQDFFLADQLTSQVVRFSGGDGGQKMVIGVVWLFLIRLGFFGI